MDQNICLRTLSFTKPSSTDTARIKIYPNHYTIEINVIFNNKREKVIRDRAGNLGSTLNEISELYEFGFIMSKITGYYATDIQEG